MTFEAKNENEYYTWLSLFRAALTGTSARSLEARETVNAALRIADLAMPEATSRAAVAAASEDKRSE